MHPSNYNPYAPPTREAFGRSDDDPGSMAWQQDGRAVAHIHQAVFPHRCIHCNAPATVRRQVKVRWHEPGLYALIFLGLLIYVIAAMVSTKEAYVEVSLCDTHVKQRRIGIGVLVASPLLGVGVMLLGAQLVSGGVALLGFFLLLTGLIFGASLSKTVSASRIDQRFVWLKAGDDFVASLPQQPPWNMGWG